MRKIFMMLCVCCLFAGVSAAQEFSEVNEDGVTIYYSVTGDGEVEVAKGGDYSGTVRVPQSVEYDGVSYTVTAIGDEAFYDQLEIEAVEMPATIKRIGESAFQMSGIKSVVIPEGVTEIDTAAFHNCESLVKIDIPDGVEVIEPATFQYCYALKRVGLSNGLKRIGDAAFNYCFSLDRIDIPETVNEIGPLAFAYCLSLKEVYCRAEEVPVLGDEYAEEWGFYAFMPYYFDNLSWGDDEYGDVDFESVEYDAVKYAKLYVPQVSTDAYRAAEGWGAGECRPEEEEMTGWPLSGFPDGEICSYFHVIEAIGGLSGVETAMADGWFEVYVSDGVVYATGAAGDVEVFDMTGRRVYCGPGAAVGTLRQGVYLFRCGGCVRKVMVK